MKKSHLISVLLTVMVINSYSQLFPEGEAIWNKYHSDVFGTTRRTQYVQQGDTLIDGLQYSKLFKSYELYSFDSLVHSLSYYNEYVGALKPDSNHNKVYFIPKDSVNEVLLYDFNLHVNDTIPVWHNEFSKIITVESIDAVIVNGISLKRFEMNYGNHKDPDYGDVIIEGIGSIKELIKIENKLEGIHGFNCFTDFQTGFKYPEDCINLILSTNDNESEPLNNISVSPNPCSNLFSIAFEGIGNDNQRIELIDLNGNKVYSTRILNKNQLFHTNEIDNGMYIILIYDDISLHGTGKVIINK